MLKGTKIFRNQPKAIFAKAYSFRSKHSNEGFKCQKIRRTSKCFHKQQTLDYPASEQLPLPLNIEDLASSEKLRFSPQRSRDINSSYISSFTDVWSDSRFPADDRIECYDCSGAINLSSAMQTNVPFPFVSNGKPIHLNMPGGQWRQKEKYVSEDLNKVHHINTRELNSRSGTTYLLGNKSEAKKLHFCTPLSEFNFFTSPWSFVSYFNMYHTRNYCTVKQKEENESKENFNSEAPHKKLTQREKLKEAVKAYGPVILVFHIGFSLISLGCCYFLVSSGVDLSRFVKSFGVDEGATAAGTAAGFVVAYAVHKSTAPVRIALSLGVAPFIVKKLRKIGILKTHKAK